LNWAPVVIAIVLIASAGCLLMAFRTHIATPPPSCGKCGYSVIGIVSGTCPECGSTLAKVGITRASPWRALSRKFLWWTIGFALLAAIAVPTAQRIVGPVVRTDTTLTLVPKQSLYQSAQWSWRTDEAGAKPIVLHVDLKVQRAGEPPGSVRIHPSDDAQPIIQRLLERLGIPVDLATTHASELARVAHRALTAQFVIAPTPLHIIRMNGSVATRAESVPAALFTIALLTSAWGAGAIAACRRHLRSRALNPAPE
jgi:predicted RNA-binding Zn-ribbon protein involved in translation (DUF1610 family)